MKMCDDPVILTIDKPDKRKVDQFAKETGNRFITTRYTHAAGLHSTGQSHNLALYLFSDSGREIFVIIGGGYFVNYVRMTKEGFVDWIKDTHPGHFEWLLFHPEWL